MAKLVTAKEAVSYIPDDAVIAVEGFIGSGVADEIHEALGEYYDEHQHPKNLTVIHGAGIGDGHCRGMNHYAKVGMVKRIIGGHWAMAPKLHELVQENKIEAYNFPQGVISQLMREASAKRPYFITNVGVDTFVDPTCGGGKLNEITTEDLVSRTEIEGDPYLVYKTPKPNVAILRGTYADERGNISFEEEPLTLEATAEAMAAKNNGGIVIVQVKKVVENGSLDPKQVKLPRILVDYIVEVSDMKYHGQTYDTYEDKGMLSSDLRYAQETVEELPLDARKVVGRRASLLIPSQATVVNYGIGMPEMVAKVLKEEGRNHQYMTTVEPGTFGGVTLGGLDFGTAHAPESIIDQHTMFDFYDGGGIDIAFLGLAECDKEGNINVSKFGSKIAGAGGFINISQNTPVVVFCGMFTAGGLKETIKNGQLSIEVEGKNKKFVDHVEHITFSGKAARRKGQKIYYVTERAVFQLVEEGVALVEIAPGVDLQRDILDQMDFKPIINQELKEMDANIFSVSLMSDK